MRKLLIALLALTSLLGAAQLNVTHGTLTAHTEVFGDSNIEPSTTAITSYLSMDDSLESINGRVIVSVSALASSKKDRDENMHETLASQTFPTATYMFESVTKNDKGYEIRGTLKLHGVSKPLSINAALAENGDTVTMNGTTSFLMTDFGIKPPVLLFLTVRDRVDIRFEITLAKQ